MTNLLLVTTLVSLLSSATALLSSNCSGTRTSGSYEVSWEVIDDNISYVMFNVSAVTTGWVAVGFSRSRLMVHFACCVTRFIMLLYSLIQMLLLVELMLKVICILLMIGKYNIAYM